MRIEDNLEAWRIFVAVASSGSISAAAVELDINMSTISRSIAGLEDEFGKLFNKKTRPWTLTSSGKELLLRVHPLIEGFNSLVGTRSAKAKQILIRFSAPASLGRVFLSELLLDYIKSHPNIIFDLQSPMGIEALRRGETDIAYLNNPPQDNDLMRRFCCSATTEAFATPEYLEKFGEPQTPEDLSHHIGFLHSVPWEPTTAFLSRNGLQSPMLKWKRVFLFQDQSNIKNMILAHQGMSVDLTKVLVADEIASGRIVPVLKGWHRKPWNFFVVTRTSSELANPEIGEFATHFATVEKKVANERYKKVDEVIRKYWEGRQND